MNHKTKTKLLPTYVILQQLISDEMMALSPFFKNNTKEYFSLQDRMSLSGTFIKDERFMASPEQIRYFQLLFLIGLSYHGGISVSKIQEVKFKNNHIKVFWEPALFSEWQPGVCDKNFCRFAYAFQKHVLAITNPNDHLPKKVVFLIQNLIQNYIKKLKKIEEGINKILDLEHLEDMFDESLDETVLFILISALPVDEINHLFLSIKDYFPEDLEISSSQGHSVNVVSLFSQPIVDITLLIERITLYILLYYSEELPIIKIITQSKTKEHIKNKIKKTGIDKSIRAILKDTYAEQVQPRLDLYNFITNHLTGILPSQ